MLFKRFRKEKNNSGSPAKPKKRRSRTGPSILTSDLIIDGALVSNGELQIDGTVNGDVRAGAAVVDFHGIIHGEVAAEEVIVRGRVIGNIRGIHVQIFANAHVEGDIISETISIENGAHLQGSIHRSEDPLGEQAAQYLPPAPSPARAAPGGYDQPDDVFDDAGYLQRIPANKAAE